MVISETLGGGAPGELQPKEVDWGIKRNSVMAILEKYKTGIPSEVWDISFERVDRAFREIENPTETATSAFIFYTRRYYRMGSTDVNGEVFGELDDSSRCLPVLDPKYSMAEEDVEALWNSMPPFEVGRVKGNLKGKEINCAIISVPITPHALEQHNGTASRMQYACPRISQATELAKKMGAKTVGLGETLASLPYHGEWLQEKFPDVGITTGHGFTTGYMYEIYMQAAEELAIELDIHAREIPVTIIGVAGSIGAAMTEILVAGGVRNLHLHDEKDVVGQLEKRRNEILERRDGKGEKLYPNARIEITGGDEQLREACQGSKIILVAVSTPEPFIRTEHVDPGTVIISDPLSMTPEEAKRGNSKTISVVGKLPDGLKNTFSYGLVEGTDPRLLEVVAIDAEGYTAETEHVTPKRAMNARRAKRKLGMDLASFQSWGRLVSLVPGPIETVRLFIAKEIEEAQKTDLSRLRSALLLPLQEDRFFEIKPDSAEVSRVFPGSRDHEEAADVVNYSYNNLYGTNGMVVDVARDKLNGLDTTVTLVATQQLGNKNVVLSSLRFVCGGNLDVFELFDMEDGYKWPHEQGSLRKPGEIGKFSFHPILSEPNGRYSDEERARFRKLLVRRLYEEGMQQMREQGVEVPYFILGRHVYNFALSVGVLPSAKVEQAKPSQSESTRAIRKKFNRYWNPDKPSVHQPALYIAPWVMQPI